MCQNITIFTNQGPALLITYKHIHTKTRKVSFYQGRTYTGLGILSFLKECLGGPKLDRSVAPHQLAAVAQIGCRHIRLHLKTSTVVDAKHQ